jgi:hypothetical protein
VSAADFPSSAPAGTASAGAKQTVCVQVLFHTTDERQAQTVAAKLIDRAHEIANLPECECDVDVSVETSSPQSLPIAAVPEPVDPSGVLPRGRPSKS